VPLEYHRDETALREQLGLGWLPPLSAKKLRWLTMVANAAEAAGGEYSVVNKPYQLVSQER
jgi:hypothetical protein